MRIASMQFIPTDNARVMEILEWAGSPPVNPTNYDPDTNHFYGLKVHTPTGVVQAQPGDWVTRTADDEWGVSKTGLMTA